MVWHRYDSSSKEYLGGYTPKKSAKGADMIEEYSTDTPVIDNKDGFARIFSVENGAWEYVEDNRGTVVYSTETKESNTIDYLGAIKEGYTLLEPSELQKWDSDKWVDDSEAIQLDTIQRLQAIYRLVIQKGKNYRASPEHYGTPLEYDVTAELEAEYTEKRIASNAGETEMFETEAMLKGYPLDTYVQGVAIASTEAFNDIAKLTRRAGTFRVITKDLILAGQVDTAKALIGMVEDGLHDEMFFHPKNIINATEEEFSEMFNLGADT